MRSVIALIALAALSGAVAAQTAYRWVDEQGKVHYSDQPPPPSARQAEEKHLSAGRPDAVPAYAVSKAAADFPVTLYTAETCAEPCAQARALLAGRGIPYVERIVKTEEDAAGYRRVFGAPDEVPAATVGRRPLRGFEAGAWHVALDEAGYPRTPLPTR
jgi:hypothetical protein